MDLGFSTNGTAFAVSDTHKQPIDLRESGSVWVRAFGSDLALSYRGILTDKEECMRRLMTVGFLLGALSLWALAAYAQVVVAPQKDGQAALDETSAAGVFRNGSSMIARGMGIFRFDTFGDQAFWGDQLGLHQTIKGTALGGIGPGLSPKTALSLGLKVDVQALPKSLIRKLKLGQVNLDDPAVTVALLRRNAVLGVTGFFNQQKDLVSIGIQCAFCHSTVDNSLAPGIGNRLDGWGNRDLNVGAIIAFAPNVAPFTDLLRIVLPTVDDAQVRAVLNAWGPGKFDAELALDGKVAGPNGPSAVLIPPIFGLAGVNLHTWTGWGSVPYWNAFVAVLEMHGQGTFFDPRLNDAQQFPIAAASGFANVRNVPDRVTSKLAPLHFYQLALRAPKPPKGSFNAAAAARGKILFSDKAKCAQCHVPPLYTEPGWNMHTPEELGIDAFQADRAPDKRYRTAPLKGLWTHSKGGFFHDGRFATLLDVINHYDALLSLSLTASEKADLVQFLLSL
jgi:hypothetical protein